MINSNESIRSLADKISPSFIHTVKGAEEFRNELESVPNETEDEDYEIKLVANWVNNNGYCDYQNKTEHKL